MYQVGGGRGKRGRRRREEEEGRGGGGGGRREVWDVWVEEGGGAYLALMIVSCSF